MTTATQYDQTYHELDLEQLHLLAVQYYRLHRERHYQFYEMRKAYVADRPHMRKRTLHFTFLRENEVRDVIDEEQMYGRFALINAAMYLMELARRGGSVPCPTSE